MNTTTKRTALTLALAAALATAALTAQDEAPAVRTEPVAGNVHVLYGQGGNIGLSIGADGVLMVDDQFARLAGAIEAATAELTDAPLEFLVNTHSHGDHTGGNEHFGAKATIVAHSNVRARLEGDGQPPPALPVVTYEEGASIHFNREEIRLLHIGPGHTDGDTVVWFTGSNVVHFGDLFFQSGYPYIDTGSGGDARGYLATLLDLVELLPEDAKLVPGHGTVTDVEGLAEFIAMLEEVFARVEGALAEGKTAAEMTAAGLLDDLDDRWGGGFMSQERFLGILAASLAE